MKSGIDASQFDTTVRPQDDLFRHVNGGWVDRTQIPGDRGRYGTFDVLREEAEAACRGIVEELVEQTPAPGSNEERVAALYRSFMDTERIESLGAQPLSSLLAQIDALTETDQIPALLGAWAREGFNGPLEMYVYVDLKDTESHIAYLEQSGLGLPDEAYYRDEQFAPILAAYGPHVEKMLVLAEVADPAGQAAAVVALETHLASAHWDRVATRDAVKTYNKMTFAELSAAMPHWDWTAWAAGLGAPEGALTDVVARQPDVLAAVDAALVEQPLTAWQSWLRWHVVHAYAPYLSEAFVNENFAFYGTLLSGMPQLRERWKRGVAFVESSVGEALGQLYVAKHFPPAAKARMSELVDNLTEAFRRDFQTLEWMSPATREQALAKLDTFRPKIGHPDVWRDYSSLTFDPTDLIGNARAAVAYEVGYNLAKIGQPVDRDEWLMTPQTVNAYYNPPLNEIVFPAAILQPPFFDAEADDAANYGGIGAVIGHEIGHGFDDQGSRYDATGTLRDWWTQEDRDAFETKTAALIAQFDELESPSAPGHKVNGGLTVGENIGDLGGLTIGYAAYAIACEKNPAPQIDGLSGVQRFFYGWAQVWKGKSREEEAIRLLAIDPHSPQELRANVARNLSEFHEAFETREGDGMWLAPEDRVRIF